MGPRVIYYSNIESLSIVAYPTLHCIKALQVRLVKRGRFNFYCHYNSFRIFSGYAKIIQVVTGYGNVSYFNQRK